MIKSQVYWFLTHTVISVLWITSYFHMMGPVDQNQARRYVLSSSPGGGTTHTREDVMFGQVTYLSSDFSSFESSSITLQLSRFKIPVFNIYRRRSSFTLSKPFSIFISKTNTFLYLLLLHEFIITGDFNIHLDNHTDYLTAQFLSVLSFFNFNQDVNIPTTQFFLIFTHAAQAMRG